MFATRYSSGILALFLWTICDTHKVAVQAQTNGTCVCQPGEIVFTLDFALGCANRTIMSGQAGIEEAVCVVTPTTTDDVPISVSAISVSEIGTDLNTLKMENYTGTFLSGDTFTYSAFAATDSDSVMNGTIPNVLQVKITGSNADNEEIINNFVIIFTNDCTIYPVLDADSTIGWVSLVGHQHYAPCQLSLSVFLTFISSFFSIPFHYLLSTIFPDDSDWTTSGVLSSVYP